MLQRDTGEAAMAMLPGCADSEAQVSLRGAAGGLRPIRLREVPPTVPSPAADDGSIPPSAPSACPSSELPCVQVLRASKSVAVHSPLVCSTGTCSGPDDAADPKLQVKHLTCTDRVPELILLAGVGAR